jgi:hypothetical protein
MTKLVTGRGTVPYGRLWYRASVVIYYSCLAEIKNPRLKVQMPFFLNLLIVGGGVQTGSTWHRGHLLSYCACPAWLRGWRIIRWNEDWQGKPKYSKKTCPGATLTTTNPTWPDPGSNPGRRGGKPATNRLSYGAALHMPYFYPYFAWDIELSPSFLSTFLFFSLIFFSLCYKPEGRWFEPRWRTMALVLTQQQEYQ